MCFFMSKKFKLGIAILTFCMLFSLVGCNKDDENKEEESSIAEASGGIIGDVTISEVSTDDEDENERQQRLQAQAYDIVNSNTKYSERFSEFRDKLLTMKSTMTFTKDEKDNNADYTYKYVNNGNDWYYLSVILDKDNNKKSEYEYLEKDGIGYSFDYTNKVIVKIDKDKIVKTRTSVLPILDGISLKEQTKGIFMGNEYDCDVYNYITPEYADDFKNLVEKNAGTVKVFYGKDGNVVGMSVILESGVQGYDVHITGFKEEADSSVFKTTKDGFKVQTAEEYLAS